MVRNSTMEPTFYEDQVGSNYGPAFNRIGGGAQVISNMKRNFSLDLNREGPQSKRPRLTPTSDNIQNLLAQHTLPDLLKLGTPDIEKLLIANENSIDNGQMITNIPTPTSQIYFQKVPTEEQEQYARGFVEALNELHHSDSSQEPGGIQYHTLEPPSSVQSTTTDSLLGPGQVQIKDEPQTVPSVSSSPPMSPIDMETQERIKLERKRQRNRVAASKCRRRKLERISRLEDKVKLLKGENSDLSQVVHRLREHVSRLKEQVIDHMHSGCQIAALPGMMSSI